MAPPDKVKIVKVIERHLNGGYRLHKNKSSKMWRLITRENEYIFTFSLNELLGLEPSHMSIFNLGRKDQYNLYVFASKNKWLTAFASKNKWLVAFDMCSSLEEIVIRLSILGYWK